MNFTSELKDNCRYACGSGGMVVTAFGAASQAGAQMLRAGGNAIDAAVAAAWALAVCEPSGSGLGGQATLLIRLSNGTMKVVDGHSHAPAAVSTETVSLAQQDKGYRACTIPSMPATLEFAQKHYGLLPLPVVMGPAIRLAREGYAITKLQRRQLKWCQEDLLANQAAGRLFLKNGQLYEVGDIFRQKELAETLGRLSDVGVRDFYQGEIARQIVEDMAFNGGLISREDLANYKGPSQCNPVAVNYRGYKVVSVAPPGGGLQILSGLKILEHFDCGRGVCDNESWYEMMAELTYTVFRQRDNFTLHPADVTPSFLKWFLSDERAGEIAHQIKTGQNNDAIGDDNEEPGETTNVCTMDHQGNAVSLTQSIQSLFGAKVANGKLGFLYNNYLCTCMRSRYAYKLSGNCIPRSNIAPVFVLQNSAADSRNSDGQAERPLLVLGAAGSRRITSAIMQVISSVFDRGLPLEEAVSFPRIHGLLSRKVYLEKPAATETFVKTLEDRFKKIKLKSKNSYSMGCVQAIAVKDGQLLAGAADPRRDGTAEAI